MEQNDIKKLVAEKLAAGVSLSDIQKILAEKGVVIKFLDLRIMASELENVDWAKFNKEEKKDLKTAEAPPLASAAENADALPSDVEEELPGFEETGDAALPSDETPAAADDDGGKIRGKTTVELAKIARPGAAACGSVKFSSGVTAEWVLYQDGRLGLDKPTGKPDQRDITEFQVELEKLLTGGAR